MNSLFNTKASLKCLLETHKNTLSKEIYDYLNSLIELEFSVVEEYLSKSDIDKISDTSLYYNVALYNIYHRIMNIIRSLDVLPSLKYTEKSNTRAYYETLFINGIYLNSKTYFEYPLIELNYNYPNENKIAINLFRKDIPVNTNRSNLSKTEKESIITSELVNRLYQDYHISEEDLEEVTLKRTNKQRMRIYKRPNIIITETIN